MLRDPLERLLSGYLNKCDDPYFRDVEKHCEPMVVFNNDELREQIDQDPKAMFAAYVDAFPIKWNVHFFPQSLYCDYLFRHFANYDFIGYMNEDFNVHLKKMSNQFGRGNNLTEALDSAFHFSDKLLHANKTHSTKGNDHAKHAAVQLKKYYTTSSVRRALQYFAIDYVSLGLEIPNWIHEILAEEV